MTVVGTSDKTITLGWTQSLDDTGVTGYGMYRGASLVDSSFGTTYQYTGLACGTTYNLAVDAYDAADNRSAKTYVSGSTAACPPPTPPPPPPPPPGDTQAPTAPTNVTVVGTSDTTISLGWSQSIDNTGVTGYGMYRGGSVVGSSVGTNYTYIGLTCGTTYSLAVDAYDAAR